jgi:TetR/AcrR family transcriptional regulator, cholesterol catabolism regulator
VLIAMREPDKFQHALPPGALSRTERNKRDKQQRIVRAARRLFGRKGFENTTTREIAEAADIGAGTLFLYADSKEALLVMIFRDEVGRALEEAFATTPTEPLLEQVMHVFRAMISHHERNFALARLFVKELPFLNGHRHGVDEVMRGLYARMTALVEAAKSRGELRSEVPAELLVHNLFGLYFQTIQLWLGGKPSPADRCRAQLRDKLELQLRGCAARRDTPSPARRRTRSKI